MKVEEWASMFTYGLAVLFLTSAILVSLPSEEVERKNISSVDLLNSTSGEVFFGDEQNKVVVVSGNTSLPSADSELVLGQSSYSFEEKKLTVSLDSRKENYSRSAEIRVVDYSVKINLSREVPETVLVKGVFGETEKFEAPDSTK